MTPLGQHTLPQDSRKRTSSDGFSHLHVHCAHILHVCNAIVLLANQLTQLQNDLDLTGGMSFLLYNYNNIATRGCCAIIHVGE